MLAGTWPTGIDRALRNKMWGNGDDAVCCRHDSKRLLMCLQVQEVLAFGASQTEAAVQVVDLVPREIRQTIAIRCPETTAADVRRQGRFPAAQLLLRPQCLLLPVSSSLFKHQGGFVGFFSYFSAVSIECHIPPLPDILRV